MAAAAAPRTVRDSSAQDVRRAGKHAHPSLPATCERYREKSAELAADCRPPLLLLLAMALPCLPEGCMLRSLRVEEVQQASNGVSKANTTQGC